MKTIVKSLTLMRYAILMAIVIVGLVSIIGTGGKDDGDCYSDEWQCDNGECIPEQWRCDGTDDCDDHSDEQGCDCFVDEWQCDNDDCIPIEWRCDGRNDCGDNSDEENCDIWSY